MNNGIRKDCMAVGCILIILLTWIQRWKLFEVWSKLSLGLGPAVKSYEVAPGAPFVRSPAQICSNQACPNKGVFGTKCNCVHSSVQNRPWITATRTSQEIAWMVKILTEYSLSTVVADSNVLRSSFWCNTHILEINGSLNIPQPITQPIPLQMPQAGWKQERYAWDDKTEALEP